MPNVGLTSPFAVDSWLTSRPPVAGIVHVGAFDCIYYTCNLAASRIPFSSRNKLTEIQYNASMVDATMQLVDVMGTGTAGSVKMKSAAITCVQCQPAPL